MFNDLDNDGLFDPGDGEQGIADVPVEVWDQAMTTVFGSTTTAADGTYFLDVNLRAGIYKVVENIDESTLGRGALLPGSKSGSADVGLLDGKERAGNLGGTVDNTQDSNEIGNIVVGAPGTTPDAVDYLFAEISPSQMTGIIWLDSNNNGVIDFNELLGQLGLEPDVSLVSLTGTDDRGNAAGAPAILISGITGEALFYGFFGLRPGTYTVTENQPASLADGKDSLGTVNGTSSGNSSVNDQFSDIVLPSPNSNGEDYNFGERPLP